VTRILWQHTFRFFRTSGLNGYLRSAGKQIPVLLLFSALAIPASSAQTTPNAPSPAQKPAKASLAEQIRGEEHQPLVRRQPFHIGMPHSHNPFFRYMPSTVPPLDMHNAPLLYQLMRSGKVYLSLHDAIALAIENNLDLAYFRYNFPIAETDIQRTKAGGAVQGVDTNIMQSTQGGFNASSSGGGSSSGLSAAGAGGIVTSALGEGTSVPSFDPYLTFKGYVDHTVTQEENIFQYGIPVLETNTIQAQSSYSQSFPLGTNLYIQYLGQRVASNSPYNVVNPTLYSNFAVEITQPFLAGFGLATNERYIHIAKRNLNITNLAFRAQVIATVTQIENIYWDLVNAYEDVQIKQQSLAFAQKTLSDDQKQLQLNAVAAIQVMKDQSAVATAEGNLTIARASLRLNELLMKNALTRSDDPSLDAMPIIPVDHTGPPDPNASLSIDQLIAEAEKNRPEAAIYQEQAEIQKNNLKSVNSELLPTLNMYGLYEGAGIAGPKNPFCALSPQECATNLPSDFPSMFANTFNYSSPEYQVGLTLQINLRNRVAKAAQFRAALQYRQSQITYEEQQKGIRFDVRNAKFALEQARARVQAAQKARELARSIFQITKQEQKLGAKSSYDTLSAENDLAQAESTLDTAETAYEKAKVDIDRATGETLHRMGVSVDDAKSGVVPQAP
jgi:outer membrane protein TolC